jgi:predicted nucleotidyltransferase
VGRSRDAHLLPLFRSDAQARILAAIFLAPDDQAVHIRAIANRADVPYSTVQREIARLEEAGLVRATTIGRTRVIAPNRSSPYFEEVQSLLIKSYGPAVVLADVLGKHRGVHGAYIYGSWAARYAGEPGPDPQDIDVAVLVTPAADRDAIEDDLASAADRLGRLVNPILIDQGDWDRSATPFLQTLRSRPLVELPLASESHVDR